MKSQTINSIPFYFFSNLEKQKEIVHFVSSRRGGVSDGLCSSLNLSLKVNDSRENVLRNRSLIAESLGINPDNMIFSGQTHDDTVEVIDSIFLKNTKEGRDKILRGVDAMITNIPNICLCILTADCASVILFDPINKAIGIAHAGWKGTVKKIAAKTIEKMRTEYGTFSDDLIAAIGPCISGEAYEVGEEVSGIFANSFKKSESIILRRAFWPKPHIDIVAANKQVLLDCGVKKENIEESGICTYHNHETFFSARQKADGRFSAGIMIL